LLAFGRHTTILRTMLPDLEKERHRLAELYSSKTNEELEELAESAASLTDSAKSALKQELSRRKLETPLQEPIADEVKAEPEKIVTLRQYLTLQEALLAKSVLDSAEIQNYLIDENTIRMDWFWSNALGGIKLQVRETDAAAAAELLDHELPEAPDEGDSNRDSNPEPGE
jgi:hypothetical protein